MTGYGKSISSYYMAQLAAYGIADRDLYLRTQHPEMFLTVEQRVVHGVESMLYMERYYPSPEQIIASIIGTQFNPGANPYVNNPRNSRDRLDFEWWWRKNSASADRSRSCKLYSACSEGG